VKEFVVPGTGGKADSTRRHPYEVGWREAASEVARRDVRGLAVECPQCGSAGFAFTKWVKKRPVKPLYVVHSNGNGHFASCLLERDQAALVREQVGVTRPDVLKTLKIGRPFVLFSGGKDSLCLLAYLANLARRINVQVTALHANTTAGFPEVETFVERVCRKLRVPLVTVRPEHDYFEIAKRWGIPGVRARWCCETLKVAPMRRYLASVDGTKVIYDGIRAAESYLRATYNPVWYHPAFKCISVSPILGWSDAKVEGYVKKRKLPRSPAVDLGTSAECWCGAYKCKADFEKLLDVHPEIFDKLIEVERAQKGRYTFLYKKGQRVRLSTIKRAKRDGK